MCGIAALIEIDKTSSRTNNIKKMTDLVKYRGPDDEGFVFFNTDNNREIYGGVDTPSKVLESEYSYSPKKLLTHNITPNASVTLGHRRLSIIDLSPAGHQPMCSRDKRYWIVFNGEIYNYRELRQELKELGYIFISETDTEVILASYAQWGKECLNKFNGMWAFVIYDSIEQIIFAARDRFGVKPLYYWFSPEGFLAFASEIKQFSVLPGWKAILNEERTYDFFRYGLLDHTHETMFKNVYQFRGGEACHIKRSELINSIEPYRWYFFEPPRFNGDFNTAKEIFKDKLIDAVKVRLVSDIPIGFSLSGGLDSSSLVCISNDLLKKKDPNIFQNVISIRSDVERYDEGYFINEVIQNKTIRSRNAYPQWDSLDEELDKIIWHQDEPFQSLSIQNEWYLFKISADSGLHVMIGGQGSDEILCGYGSYLNIRCKDLIRSGKLFTLLNETIASFLGAKTQILLIIKSSVLLLFGRVIELRRDKEIKKFLNLNKSKSAIEPKNSRFSSLIKKEMEYEEFFMSLPVQLHWEDRDSMAHSVESRVPFTDYKLVEYIFSIPDDYLMKNFTSKFILREAMQNILPEKVRLRKDKMGFVSAEEHWMKSGNPIFFKILIEDAIKSSQGIINNSILYDFEKFVAGEKPFSDDFIKVICFGRWMKIFNVHR